MDEDETTTQQTNPTPTQTTPVVQAPAAPTQPAPTRVIGSGGQELSEETIRERAAKERRKVLVDEYGTDDPTKIEGIKKARAAEKEELARLRRVEEQRKRRSMSEAERVAAELAQARAEAQAAKDELKQVRRGAVVEQQDRIVSDIATQHIAPEHLRYARRDLAEHLKGLPPEKAKKFDKAKLEKWFADYAAEKPFFAKPKGDPAAPTNTEPKPTAPPARRALARPDPPASRDRKPAPGSNLTGKTVKPGQPNSMTKQELAQYKKQHGYTF